MGPEGRARSGAAETRGPDPAPPSSAAAGAFDGGGGHGIMGTEPAASRGSVHLQHGEERFLRDLDGADLFHALFALLLFLEELALARDITAIALGQHILPERLDGRAGDHLGPDRRLDYDLEQLTGNEFFEFGPTRTTCRGG